MKKTVLIMFLSAFYISVFSQSFTLPGDGNWYRIAVMGGAHANFEYHYSHWTGNNPSVATGEITYINAQNYMIQHHQTMGYQAWNQPQFALLNLGNGSEVWVKATNGVDPGTFTILRSTVGSITSGDIHDNDLSDNGGTLTIYDKLKDNANIFYGNIVIPLGNVSIGSGNIDPNYSLAVKGKLHAEEVKVEAANWPDYVFEKGYKTFSLSDLQNYINTNQHLPDMPSAKDVKENGIHIGDMNKRLLRKIEELTLYLIEKDNTEKLHDQQLKYQKSQIDKLTEKLAELSKRVN